MLIRLLLFVVILLVNGCASNMWDQEAGNKIAASGRTNITSAITKPPHNIAVMLPLKGIGELAATSQAINNGILAAYYSSKQQANISIHVIDTAGGDVGSLYQQAVANGADVVIGPLTKPEVESIASIDSLPVPTVALNTLDDYHHKVVNNLYQFGLLPQDEAAQVAKKMAEASYHGVAIVAPDSVWGDKVAATFADQYGSFGGQVVATLKYKTGKNLAEQVCGFLASNAEVMCVPQKNKNKKDFYEQMRRQDIDAVFLIATTPAQARLIVPLLRFYYASDLPIYSLSTIYSGTTRPDLDQDINAVYFCDMPWVIQDVTSLAANLQVIYQQIVGTALWANSFMNYRKFYALGIDAYNLALELDALSHGGVVGASGTLYLDSSHHIYRKLQWAEIKNGVVQSL